jgi:hypothetical protein
MSKKVSTVSFMRTFTETYQPLGWWGIEKMGGTVKTWGPVDGPKYLLKNPANLL